MDHFKVTKNDINLLEIKVENHPIKIEPEYYQEPLIDNNFQVQGVKIESDFVSQSKTTEKEFQCGHCCKSFTRNQNLLVHQIIHTGEKPFQCSQCSKCFIRKMTL